MELQINQKIITIPGDYKCPGLVNTDDTSAARDKLKVSKLCAAARWRVLKLVSETLSSFIKV